MSPLDDAERRSRLWHIADSCAAIVDYTKTRTFDDYVNDRMMRRAIERELTIVGEAMVRLRKADPEIASRITDVPDIIGFRNRLIHDYPQIKDTDVWKIVQQDIPLLLAEVRSLLPAT